MGMSAETPASVLEAKKWPKRCHLPVPAVEQISSPSHLLPGVPLLGIHDPERELFSRPRDLVLNQLKQKFESEINLSLS